METEDQVVFGEHLALLDYKVDRRDELDRHIEALALEPTYKEAVGRLCCLKGISTQAAMVLVTEIGEFRRFEHPGKMMAYVAGWRSLLFRLRPHGSQMAPAPPLTVGANPTVNRQVPALPYVLGPAPSLRGDGLQSVRSSAANDKLMRAAEAMEDLTIAAWARQVGGRPASGGLRRLRLRPRRPG
ncbi:MAG: hypothetical protein OXL34_06740 [Gemmatimonadota bacterium]|nr:hypothetical protein [Gemmatimonadota bacterium]